MDKNASKVIATIELSAAFSTIAVYNEPMEKPYNGWMKQHIQQGFSWRPGSVSFSCIGSVEVTAEIWLTYEVELLSETQRAIQVPFSVDSSEQVAISGVGGIDKIVKVPSGTYNLLFENGFRYDVECSEEDDELGLRPMWCRLSFIPSQSPRAEILREMPGLPEGQLSPTYPLLMEAQPV